MKIILAGYNLDQDTLQSLRQSNSEGQALTPETISAAYARISRDPRPVDELRRLARQELEKSRQSNKNIVFDMGHSSIAEHAVFNLDIIGVSRLLVEEIEKFRLVSYTEKSQRYVLLTDDFVLPDEIKRAGLTDLFIKTIKRQIQVYQELYKHLREHLFRKYPAEAAKPQSRLMVEGWAKEDARYVLSLATETQLGMTINARNLELMIRRLSALMWAEAREYAEKLYTVTHHIAPSLIRYTKVTDYDLITRQDLRKLCRYDLISPGQQRNHLPSVSEVELVAATKDADLMILSAMLHSSSQMSLASCLSYVREMDEIARRNLVKTACRHLKAYDPVLREFEYADLLFELTISASCFAQLKRHRMATMTCQEYDPGLGTTIPPNISEIGRERMFEDLMSETFETYRKIQERAPEAAGYILTNAHRRRVALKVNARQLYHMSRLRADSHSQWDIRRTVQQMLNLAKEAMPLTFLLATGKDDFPLLYHKVYASEV